jgi:hypothetical protein
MPQWLAGEIGYALAIVGFVLIVREWFHVFDTQGNSLAREDLRIYLRGWRKAPDEPTRTANIRRMQERLPEIKGTQRELFTDYVATLSSLRLDQTQRLDELDDAFNVGTPIEEKEQRPRRRKLMIIGTTLVIVGCLGQMVSTAPEPFGPFCKNNGWALTCSKGQ